MTGVCSCWRYPAVKIFTTIIVYTSCLHTHMHAHMYTHMYYTQSLHTCSTYAHAKCIYIHTFTLKCAQCTPYPLWIPTPPTAHTHTHTLDVKLIPAHVHTPTCTYQVHIPPPTNIQCTHILDVNIGLTLIQGC